MPNVIETTDAAGDSSTAYNLGVGQTAQGRISAGDHDWYRVNLVAGHTYTFAMAGEGALTNNVRDTFLSLYGGTGTLITQNDDGGPGLYSTITFTASSTGTYYLDAAGFNSSYTGQYGLSVTESSLASYDIDMGAGALLVPNASWSSTPLSGVTVTYGFRQSIPSYSSSGHPTTQSSFTQLSAAEIDAVHSIMQFWGDVANINFVEVNPGGYTDNASILFGNYFDNSDGAGAFAYYPGSTAPTASNGDVFLNTGSVSTSSLPFGSYSFFAIMHEVGHALGLSHPGDYNAAPGVSITYSQFAQFSQDTQQYTVMSYFDESNTGAFFAGYANTPMLYDVFALQQLYGVNTSTRTGATTYGFNSTAGSVYNFATNPNAAFTIWDAGGNDTLDCSGFSQAAMISLLAGTFSSVGGWTSNVAIASGVAIENAFGGSGSDTIVGNELNNVLRGNGGNDTLNGLFGNDWIEGGSGTNTINGSVGWDRAAYAANSGSATITYNAITGATTISLAGISDTLRETEVAVFSDRSIALREAAHVDVNNSGTSAILWLSTAGELVDWWMGNGALGGSSLIGVASGWTFAGTGDFNGDGNTDVLWSNASGQIVDWTMSNGNLSNSRLIGTAAGWSVVGSADLNADGSTDILFRNSAGQIVEWLTSSGGVSQSRLVGSVSSEWILAGTGDFNGDGTADILWRSSASGAVVEWLMSNGDLSVSALVGSAASRYQIVGTGDFNGGGTTDILFRDTVNGDVIDWIMANGAVSQSMLVGNASGWTVRATGDYNGNGVNDILLHNASNGQAVEWLMSGGTLNQSILVGTATPGVWSVAA